MSESIETEWTSSSSLSAIFRETSLNVTNLIAFARDGLVRTRAKWYWARYGGDAEPVKDVDLASSFWKQWSERWRDHRSEWATGTFSYRDLQGWTKRASGVQFAVNDLIEVFPDFKEGQGARLSAKNAKAQDPKIADPSDQSSILTVKAASPAPKWDWEPILIDLIAFAHGEGLHEIEIGKRGGQAALEKWMADRWGEVGPSESEIRKRAKAVRHAVDIAAMKEGQKTK